MTQQSFDLVVDFSTNILVASTEDSEFVSSITPNNFLAVMDFLKDNKAVVLPDFSNEIEYSVAE